MLPRVLSTRHELTRGSLELVFIWGSFTGYRLVGRSDALSNVNVWDSDRGVD